MKRGDIVYCKENFYSVKELSVHNGFCYELIKGKKYVVIDTSSQPYIKVINEYEHYIWYGIELFADLKENRKQKLKKIYECRR